MDRYDHQAHGQGAQVPYFPFRRAVPLLVLCPSGKNLCTESVHSIVCPTCPLDGAEDVRVGAATAQGRGLGHAEREFLGGDRRLDEHDSRSVGDNSLTYFFLIQIEKTGFLLGVTAGNPRRDRSRARAYACSTC